VSGSPEKPYHTVSIVLVSVGRGGGRVGGWREVMGEGRTPLKKPRVKL